MNKPTYRIRDWDKHYAFGDFKKCPKATWFPLKTKYDGKSYRRLMNMPNGPVYYAAWVLIVGVASRCAHRGTLKDDDGPLTTEDLSLKTGMPQDCFDKAVEALISVGWLEIVDEGSNPDPNPAQAAPVSPPAESFRSHRNSSDAVGEVPPTRQDTTVHDRTVQDKNITTAAPCLKIPAERLPWAYASSVLLKHGLPDSGIRELFASTKGMLRKRGIDQPADEFFIRYAALCLNAYEKFGRDPDPSRPIRYVTGSVHTALETHTQLKITDDRRRQAQSDWRLAQIAIDKPSVETKARVDALLAELFKSG